MKYHFISIGGSIMHNMAIAMHLKGCKVTGSDDEIFDPAKSNLKKYNLLPDKIGWDPERITNDIDMIILGMHAKSDNPELIRAKELGLKIVSFPEFIYENSKNKIRIVIGGSHGKTTVTSMILHVLKQLNIKADYLVGTKVQGYDVMVNLSDDAKWLVVEGDEYLTSTLDPRPKFHLYYPHIALLTGVAWDHFNVFPSLDNYVDQFKIFTEKIEKDGNFIYFAEDKTLKEIADNIRADVNIIPYKTPEYTIDNNIFSVKYNNNYYPLMLVGKHNMQNLSGAMEVCKKMGIDNKKFLQAMQSFKGASKRMELIKNNDTLKIYRDFAHAPSKVKATVDAIKEQFPNKKVIAIFELHTYSSLNIDFMPQYKGSMDSADKQIVFFNPHSLEIKKLPAIDKQTIMKNFANASLDVFDNVTELRRKIMEEIDDNTVLLLMSSGNFGDMNIDF